MSDRAAAPARLTPARDWGLVALAVLPVLALAVVAIVSVGHGYHGAEDNGMTELRISDIGRHWPQIGPFSRDGWSHPGPALFYVLLLPYRLTGGHSNGLLVGAALVNAFSIGGMVVLARRRGGIALALLMALGSLILVISLGLTFVWNPWNPYITVLPFGLAVLATWCIVCGDAWCIPVLAAVGSFCAQAHIGNAPLVAVLAVMAGVGLALRVRSTRSTTPDPPHLRLRAPVLLTVGILAVAWVLPVFQQLTADHGNLWAIWQYFRSGRSAHSVADGFDVVTAQFAWNAGWLTGRTDINPFSAQPLSLSRPSWPLWWIGLGAALAWTWMRGRRTARALGVVLAVMIIAAIAAIARTLGPVYAYRLRFVWVLGMLTAVYAVWVLALAVAPHVHRLRRCATAGTALAVIAIVSLSAYGVGMAITADPPRARESRVIATLVPQLVQRLSQQSGVVVPESGTLEEFALLNAVMVDLEHHGIPVRKRDQLDDRLRFGDHRILGHENVRAELRIAVDDEIEKVAATKCARMLAYRGRVSRPERARAVRAVERIERALATERITGPEAFRRLRRWSPELPATAVFRTDCP